MDPSLDRHHWSGWPGAICLKCHREDPMEIALADNTYEPWSGVWATEDLKAAYIRDSVCPIKGVLVWDQTTKQWNLNDGRVAKGIGK